MIEFFIGRGIWKGKNWARIIVIVFSAIGILFSLFGAFARNTIAIIGLIVNIAIGGYLLLSKEAKSAFS